MLTSLEHLRLGGDLEDEPFETKEDCVRQVGVNTNDFIHDIFSCLSNLLIVDVQIGEDYGPEIFHRYERGRDLECPCVIVRDIVMYLSQGLPIDSIW